MNRILVATLADGVQAMPGQKFSVLGGGFDNLNATVFPAVFPRISLLLALEIEAGTDVPMACQVTLRRKSDGEKIFEVGLNLIRNGSFDHSAVVWQGLDLPPLTLSGPGKLILEATSADSKFSCEFEVQGPPAPIFPGVDQNGRIN